MTNQQLYLAVGLPTLTTLITLILVVLAWVSTHSTTKDLRAEMDRRIDRLETRMEKRFDAVDARFDAIDVELRYFHLKGATTKPGLPYLKDANPFHP